MFDNTRFSSMDEAVSRILNLLANVADITEPKNYIFDVESNTFKLRKKKKQVFNNRKFEITWLKISFYCLLIPILALMIFSAVVSRNHYKITSPWSPIGILLFFLLGIAGIAEISIIIWLGWLALMFIKAWGNRKEPARKMIEQAEEDAIAYQPVVNEIFKIAKGQQQTLKVAESIIENLIIEESQAREKILSNLLPILVTSLIILMILLGFPIQLSGNTSLYNTAITIVGWGTLVLPIGKFITESGSQSLILKFKRCLFLLEQAQAKVNNTNQ